ncbi:PLP-dependent cysteine synthase family protein [Acetobacterium sp.]|jgi:cysteine synthase A|uniref:PLP-dependent cysteine synthase family protein n=1 Tax=Acetobacterium sp. TaxID=1872094 RepID=UPI000CC956D2|nr:PLP-dependent cysteine synthase family protein [Acetobacterium sp.]MDO9492710.1 PLP-dependent cysteine synthase family protein [Acetobacterium sp.]PKM75140.1 MAG: cysteine synthase [Firmicutes bacterium HGW-Firmicutes-17]
MDNEEKFIALEKLIGDTPLLKINFLYQGQPRCVYAKAEHYNLTGSIKDRVALHILKKAYEKGEIHAGETIVEATSGNTGIAFTAVGTCLGHPVVIYMPDWMSDERKNLIRSYGGEVRLVSKEEGGFLGSIAQCGALAAKGNAFLPCQFSNEENTQAQYERTAPEIDIQLAAFGVTPQALVAGVGTGGTVMGLGRYFKEKNPDIKVHPMEPASSPTMSTGYKVGSHRIQGISDEFVPDLIKLEELDDIIAVDDGDAIIMAQKLSKELGLGVGISSGANFIAAIIAQNLLEDPNAVVVTVFADDNKKYLSTDYVKEEKVKLEFLSKDVKLLDFEVRK